MMFANPPALLLAWTTVPTRAAADALALRAIEPGLAVCVQVDGPLVSHYRWKGEIERAEEFRLTFKFLPETAVALERLVRDHHPYDTPEWIVVSADRVSEKYLSWAKANPSTPPL